VTASALAAVLSFIPAAERFAAPLGALALLVAMLLFFPNLANHTFLLLVLLAPFVLWNVAVEHERVLALGTLRWAVAIVLFSSGLQKVLHGTYFQGEFLAFQIAHGERFARAFDFLVPASEMARLKALGASAGAGVVADGFRSYVTGPPLPGSGPYRLESPVALAAVNAVWSFELLAPFLLLWKRTRAWVAAIAVVFLLALETGALELMFGALFAASVLLFFRANVLGVALPVLAVAYALLTMSQLGGAGWPSFN
jgi:hypothetical protein